MSILDSGDNFISNEPSKFLGDRMNDLQCLFKEIESHLLLKGETVSTAESNTAGFLQFSFSQMKDASKFFRGGMTVYTLEETVNLLKVDENEASQCDCVSSNIAETMALHVAKIYNTDWSIAITGYATPVEESQGELFAYYSISQHGKILVSEKIAVLKEITLLMLKFITVKKFLSVSD